MFPLFHNYLIERETLNNLLIRFTTTETRTPTVVQAAYDSLQGET
jgi:hypothetical protein